MFESISLPLDPALEYFRGVLEMAGLTGQTAIADRLRLGRFYAIAPAGTGLTKLLKFKEAGLLPDLPIYQSETHVIQAVDTTLAQAARIVNETIERHADSVLWIHEPMLTQIELMDRSRPARRLGEQLYLVYPTGCPHPRSTEDLLRYSLLSWHFLGFLVPTRHSAQSTEDLVRSAKLMIVGAYDGESFVYWSP
jgi:hypothetical protein